MCSHNPTCPTADRPDRGAARVVAYHASQGWGRLCNGVIIFDDAGQLLPDGRAVPPPGPVPPGPVSLADRRRPAPRADRALPVAA